MDWQTIGMYALGALIVFYMVKSSIKLLFYIIVFGTFCYAVYTYLWPSLQPMLEEM